MASMLSMAAVGLALLAGGVRGGLPVINIPGCPAHPDWITQILVAISVGRIGDVLIDDYHRPTTFFSDFVQNGCTNAVAFSEKEDGHFAALFLS